MTGNVHNMAAFIRPVVGVAPYDVTANGTNDNTTVNGATINRLGLDQLYLSGELVLVVTVALGAGETAVVNANFQDSADGSSWAAYGTAMTAVTLSASGTYPVPLPIDLAGARQYVRAQANVNLSRANTDTAKVAGVVVLGGGHKTPTA